MTVPSSFGVAVSQRRKEKKMSQKELAALIKREDDLSISPQYLNDIEHDRRSPSSEMLIKQLANVLDMNEDVLYFLAGKIPADLVNQQPTPEKIERAMVAFRQTIRG
jgi:transcriptional regulator with XRE-family HTH domain